MKFSCGEKCATPEGINALDEFIEVPALVFIPW